MITMMNAEITGWVFLTATYLSLTVAGVVSVLLYRYAYLNMKRTRMIKSVYWLLITLALENIYFLVTSAARWHGHVYLEEFLTNPWLWSVPKVLLLFALVYFIYASLCPTPDQCLKTAKDLHNMSVHIKDKRR